jgi:hypothetical protein
MTLVRADSMTRIAALFGGCKRCTRTSRIAALIAWAAALAAWLLWRNLTLTLCAALLATALTALWIAHIVAHASRGTLASMLRQFGAEPREAKAIIAALALPEHGGADRDGRLKDGEALSVQRAQRPGRPGFRLTRVTIANDRGVVAAVELTGDGAYAALDPASAGAETSS